MRSPGLTTQIFIGLALGVAVGHFAPHIGTALSPGADIFLRLIKTIIAPLVFATLVVGIAGAGSMHAVGRLGLKSMIFFEVVTTLALVVGLLVVNVAHPGVGVDLTKSAADFAQLASKQPSGAEILTHAFPTSIVDSMARGDVLQIVVFSILFAAAAGAAKAQTIIDLCQSLAEVMFKYTGYVMKLAPLGVACAMAATVGEHGLGVLKNLGFLVGTLYVALAIFTAAVLVPIVFMFKIPFKTFVNAVKEPALIAFSTTSSEAALPKAMLAMEGIGVPRHIVSFVLPVGYAFNLTGTTLYLSLAAMFVAQAAGIHLSIQQQLMMMLTLMLTSKGVAAVPRASLVILAGTLSTFNLPLAGIALILGVDTLMDMARTCINLVGNCLACAVMAKWEGVYGQADPHEVSLAQPEPELARVPVEAGL